jgi:hypothetical protein
VLAVLIRFTWTYLSSVTIDLKPQQASSMPRENARFRPIVEEFIDDESSRNAAFSGHTSWTGDAPQLRGDLRVHHDPVRY